MCCGGISPAIQTDFEAKKKLCKDDDRYASKPPLLPSSEMSYPSLCQSILSSNVDACSPCQHFCGFWTGSTE